MIRSAYPLDSGSTESSTIFVNNSGSSRCVMVLPFRIFATRCLVVPNPSYNPRSCNEFIRDRVGRAEACTHVSQVFGIGGLAVLRHQQASRWTHGNSTTDLSRVIISVVKPNACVTSLARARGTLTLDMATCLKSRSQYATLDERDGSRKPTNAAYRDPGGGRSSGADQTDGLPHVGSCRNKATTTTRRYAQPAPSHLLITASRLQSDGPAFYALPQLRVSNRFSVRPVSG